MISFSQFLTEGRDAPLYHGTFVGSAASIIGSNEITGQPSHTLNNKKTTGVSLTRSKKYAGKFALLYAMKNSNYYVIFELDQRKLAQDYKIQPVNFGTISASPSNHYTRKYDNAEVYDSNEYEEFVTGSIKNLNKYLLKIIVPDDSVMNSIEAHYSVLYNHPLLWYGNHFVNGHGEFVNKF